MPPRRGQGGKVAAEVSGWQAWGRAKGASAGRLQRMIATPTSIEQRSGRDLRVLLIAEAANPEWASVPLVGWSHARAIADITDAHIVTQVRNRKAFERAGVPGEAYTAIDSEAVAARIHDIAERLGGSNGKGWTLRTAFGALSYYYFERLVWKKFHHRIARGDFDIVHRLTPLSPTVPSQLANRCRRLDVPFVLGPLNGGVPWPTGFDSARRKEREWLSYIRGAYRLLPGYRKTRRDASAIIIASRDTWQQMPGRYHGKCVYIPENGLDEQRLTEIRKRNEGQPRCPLRVVYLGRLVPYKGADMLVEAASELLRAGLLTLTIIGDGPERPRIERMVRECGLHGRVRFTGWVQHDAAQQLLQEADVLGSPSIREFGGGVVLEAMAAGVVPMVVNYGGPAELVTPRTGYAIDIGSREQIVARFRAGLSDIARDPSQLAPRSAAAQERAATQFTWQHKARQCLEVYRWVLGKRENKPDFGMPLPDLNEQVNSRRQARAGLATAGG